MIGWHKERGGACPSPLHVRSIHRCDMASLQQAVSLEQHSLIGNCRHMNPFLTKHHHRSLFPPKLSAVSPSLFLSQALNLPECVWPRNMTSLYTPGTTPTRTTTYLREQIPPSLFPSSSETLRSTWAQVNVKAASRSLPPVLSQVLNLPPPTHPPTSGPYSMQAARPLHQDAPSRMNMSHDTKTNSLVIPAPTASCLLGDGCLHAPPLLLPPYRVPTLLSVFCPRSRKRVHKKAVFSEKHSPSPRPTPTSQIATKWGSVRESARPSTLELLMTIFTRTNTGNWWSHRRTTTTLASYGIQIDAAGRSVGRSSQPASERAKDTSS